MLQVQNAMILASHIDLGSHGGPHDMIQLCQFAASEQRREELFASMANAYL